MGLGDLQKTTEQSQQSPISGGGGGGGGLSIDTGGTLPSFRSSPFYSAMPESAYMTPGLKQDDPQRATQSAQQAQNMRQWNDYLDKVHMSYLSSMKPNYETQSYDFQPTDQLMDAYNAKPSLYPIQQGAADSSVNGFELIKKLLGQ